MVTAQDGAGRWGGEGSSPVVRQRVWTFLSAGDGEPQSVSGRGNDIDWRGRKAGSQSGKGVGGAHLEMG